MLKITVWPWPFFKLMSATTISLPTLSFQTANVCFYFLSSNADICLFALGGNVDEATYSLFYGDFFFLPLWHTVFLL